MKDDRIRELKGFRIRRMRQGEWGNWSFVAAEYAPQDIVRLVDGRSSYLNALVLVTNAGRSEYVAVWE